jgi:hypothetical protein
MECMLSEKQKEIRIIEVSISEHVAELGSTVDML